MKRKILAYFGVLLSSVLLIGCGIGTISLGNMGRLLSVDENGHFSEDIVYSQSGGLTAYHFKQNGEYESLTYSFEDSSEDIDNDGTMGEGWIYNSGIKGTYFWNPETFLLTITNTHEYVNGIGGKKDWVQLTNASDIVVMITTAYFTEAKIGNCGVKDESVGNQWTFINANYNKDGSYNESIALISINIDMEQYTENNQTTSYDGSGNITSGNEYNYKYTISATYPNDSAWTKNNIVTFSLDLTEYQRRSYLSGSAVWDNWSNISQSGWSDGIARRSKTYGHFGDFIVIQNDAATYRDIESANNNFLENDLVK